MTKQYDKEELRTRLTPLQYHVTQERGTERPFSGIIIYLQKLTIIEINYKNDLFLGCYNKTFEVGTYVCIVCEQPLFSSETKYDSHCGWPAFNDVLDQGKIKLSPDTSGGTHY